MPWKRETLRRDSHINRDYGKLMPSTIGISANKIKYQLNFNLVLDVLPEKSGDVRIGCLHVKI